MTSIFKLFNAKNQNASKRRGRASSPLKPRKLMTEALEERQLLAVDPLATAAVETANVIQIASNELSVDAIKQAIAQAAVTPEDDVVQIPEGALQFAAASDEITINVNSSTKGSITIAAAGAGLTIDANSLARAFSIKSGDVTLRNITVVNGVADYGGAIANAGDLTLVDVALRDNLAMVSGGAVANKGSLTIEDSLIAGNGAMDSGSAIFEGDFSWPAAVPTWDVVPNQVGSKGSTLSVDLRDYINDGDWSYSYSVADTTSVILAAVPTIQNGVLTFTFIDDADYYAEDDYSAIDVTVTASDGKKSASTTFSVSLAEQTSVTLAAILSNQTFNETEAQYRQCIKNRVIGYASVDGVPVPSIVDVSDDLAVQVWLQDFDWTGYENKIWDAGDFYIIGVEYRLHLENATIQEFTAAADLARDSYVYKRLDNGDYEFIVVYTAGSNFGYEEALLLDVLTLEASDPSKPVSATIYQINTDFTYPCLTRLYDEPTERDPSRSHINVDPSQTLFVSTISNSTTPLSAIPGQPFATSTFATLDESTELVSNAVSEFSATTSLYNVTISGNTSSSGNGAIFLQAGATAALYNTIVAVNNGGDVVTESGAVVEARHVLSSYSGWSNSDAVSYAYRANEPLFADAAAGDYSLASGSQALDMGDNSYVHNAYDLAGKPRVQNETVDLGAYELSESSGIAFTYDASTRQAELTWEAIAGATSYAVKLSKNGGETWSNYTKTSDLTATVSGLYAGKSYNFRIVASDSSGATLPTVYEAVFAPISLSSDVEKYSAGDTINLTLTAAANGGARIRWYQVTGDGDVEIVAARGLLSYTPSRADYDIKVIASGVDDSLGANVELTIPTTAAQIKFDYAASARKAILTWNAISGAATYTVKISKDGGATWANYVRGVTGLTATVAGLYSGKSYDFQVCGVDSSGATLATVREATFAPITAVASAASYSAGDVLTLTVTGAENASADVRWYQMTGDGDVEITEAAGLFEYVPTSDSYNLRAVVTGTGDSAGCDATFEFATTAPQIFFAYSASTRQAQLSWNGIQGAANYTVKISKNGGETWSNYAKTSELTTTVSGLYTGMSYDFRIVAADSSGATLSTVYEATFAPIALSSSVSNYSAGDTISLTLTAAENASADVRWYQITGDGDVEITEAAGLLEYAPASAQYDIRVVATGTNNSFGSNSEVTLQAVAVSITFEHDASTNQATLSWNAISGAATYTVKVSQNGSEIWTVAASGVADVTATVGGVYAGDSYSFQVYGIENSGAELSTVRTGTLAPIAISTASANYSAGTAIELTLTADASASAEIRWFQIVDGTEVEIESARDSLSYTPTSTLYDIKVVATGTGVSLGSSSSLTLTPASLGSVSLVRYTYTSDVHQALIKWPTVPGAAYYNLEYSENGGETWKLYAKNFKNYYKGVNGVYPGKTYSFRVMPLDANKQPMSATYIEGTFAPVVLTNPAANYTAGTKIELTKLASEDGSSTVKWYYVTNSGDVEIKSARNQLVFTPDVADYDIKIVSTGTGLSLKSNYELTLSAQCAIDVQFNYDPTTRKAVMTWDAFADAATYTVKLSKNGGETWTTYKSNLTTPETTVSGLYTGNTYAFRIMGLSSSKSTLATYQTSFSPSANSGALLDEAFADFFEEELFEEF